jgi:hypothetical protein
MQLSMVQQTRCEPVGGGPGRAFIVFADGASDLCLLIRAYNESMRSDFPGVQALGQWPGEIARVLDGLLPVKSSVDD